MTARRYTGRIVYRTAVGPCGHEVFAIDVRGDGRTIRAYCEMDEGALTRDASWTLDSGLRPVEGHVRVAMDGMQVGSSWYRCTEGDTECESLTRSMGRVSQRLPGRAAYLGLHPLVGDGMIALARGRDAPGEERMIESVTCSYDIKGESGLLALPITIGVTYVGPEEIEVAAGRFAADHYLLNWQAHWPPAKLWVTGEDAVFLRMSWEVSGRTYELVQLHSGPTSFI